MPPVIDQHATPMCVAYSSSAVKAGQDRRDQERFFDFDEPAFFAAIGGTASGARVRDAMERMRSAGYPVAGSGDAAHHRIAAYYAVPRDVATIKAAIHGSSASANRRRCGSRRTAISGSSRRRWRGSTPRPPLRPPSPHGSHRRPGPRLPGVVAGDTSPPSEGAA
jgi:hypothetical protein